MNYDFAIDDKSYNSRNLFIIAELGTSHAADILKAKELVHAAAEAGADSVKFQIVYADEILHPNTGLVDLPGGKIRLYDRFKELEVQPDFFAEIKHYVESKGLLFLATPFGLRSAKELYGLNPKAFKVASPELNYDALLREVSSYNQPVFLSSGVSKLSDIERAVSLLRCPVCLLHCVTAYPAPETDYNVRLLKALSAIFSLPVGVSDHSLDPTIVPVLSVAMGAVAIEKHFCLSRDDSGLDDPIALPPSDFAFMVKSVRDASKRSPDEIIDEMSKKHGADVVQAVLGDGAKRFAPSELENYERTNRSLHALRDINEGEVITEDMFASLRTEKVLRPGLAPMWAEKICGRRARVFIPSGEGIRFEDI